MTMFPDSSNESEEIPSTQILQDRQTNLQKMAQPSQVLRAAVQNLVNYQVINNYILLMVDMINHNYRVTLN